MILDQFKAKTVIPSAQLSDLRGVDDFVAGGIL